MSEYQYECNLQEVCKYLCFKLVTYFVTKPEKECCFNKND